MSPFEPNIRVTAADSLGDECSAEKKRFSPVVARETGEREITGARACAR